MNLLRIRDIIILVLKGVFNMNFIQAKICDMENIYSQMEENFVHEEIRDYPDALKVFDNEKYTVYHVVKDGTVVGFMCVWNLSGFSFLEHFVIFQQFRGKGYGGAAFDMLSNQCRLLVLECEPPDDAIKKRRVEFYKRHGMIWNEDNYYQPSYRKDGEGCNLRLMSSKTLINFKDTVKEIYREVYKTEYDK